MLRVMSAQKFPIPLALRYSDEYQDVLRHFDRDQFLHNLAVRKMDGSDDLERIAALRQIALLRMEDRLIAEDALDRLVRACGGITVDLIRLVNGAALHAQARSDKARAITLVDAENSVKDLRRELSANLSRADWQLLAQRHNDHEPSNEAEMQRLFYKGALIEYSNGVQWCDVHSLLEDQIERYTTD